MAYGGRMCDKHYTRVFALQLPTFQGSVAFGVCGTVASLMNCV